ncbi:DNA primase small subunit [Delphinella strobiligena]|nr:DNA primase small subunit [Delphinella strobiligena]
MPHAESPASSPPVQDDTVMSEAVPKAAEEGVQTPDVQMEESEQKSGDKTSLEDMFDDEDDEDDDDEFASSAPTKQEDSSQEQALPKTGGKSSDPEILRAFYQRLFPFRYLFQWLNHSPTPTTDWMNREFAFVLPNDAYIRYQSFLTADQFRKQCVHMTPVRFEIGPVYSTNPRDRKTLRKASAFRPLSKELVFDIDMTDYDEIRTCCSGANICQKCWTFITMAIKVVDAALKEDFGFKHILWVYSGRRGAHAWISDKRAREMDDQKRRAIAGYLELLRGGDKSGKKVNVKRPLHPHVERSYTLLKPFFFDNILPDQDPWATPERSSHLLSLLPDKTLTTALQKKWDSQPNRSSAQKWADIDALAKAGSLSTTDTKPLMYAKQDICLEYTYPRLDAEVSKKLNHLLKSPFVIHPGTGRVCVPIDMRKVEDFRPMEVPTVQRLLAEIDEWETKGREEKEKADDEEKLQDWQKTSLRPFVEFFRSHVGAVLKDEGVEKKRGREEAGEGMEF